MSDLVGNPEDRFSRVAAHITIRIKHIVYKKSKSTFTNLVRCDGIRSYTSYYIVQPPCIPIMKASHFFTAQRVTTSQESCQMECSDWKPDQFGCCTFGCNVQRDNEIVTVDSVAVQSNHRIPFYHVSCAVASICNVRITNII